MNDYTHWTNRPVTPGVHEVALVPQSMFDGWAAYCSCGEWETFVSMLDANMQFRRREETMDVLRQKHAEHVQAHMVPREESTR